MVKRPAARTSIKQILRDVRMRYRQGLEAPVFMKKGAVYPVTIDFASAPRFV